MEFDYSDLFKYSIDDLEALKQSEATGTIGLDMFTNDALTDTDYSRKMEVEDSIAPSCEKEESSDVLESTLISKGNYSKDCLKFCRKIASTALEQLSAQNECTKAMINLNSSIIANLIANLNLNNLDTAQINELQANCLRELWLDFKDNLSYSKNKKICIVKQEYWNIIFEKSTSRKHLVRICNTISKADIQENVRIALKEPVFVEIFTQLLYGMNRMLVLTTILRDPTEKGEFLRSLETIHNFLVLGLLPEYYQFYNHRSGQFALECCGKCKICKSKALPVDFLEVLTKSRKQTDVLISRINQLFINFGNDDFQLATMLLEIAYSHF